MQNGSNPSHSRSASREASSSSFNCSVCLWAWKKQAEADPSYGICLIRQYRTLATRKNSSIRWQTLRAAIRMRRHATC